MGRAPSTSCGAGRGPAAPPPTLFSVGPPPPRGGGAPHPGPPPALLCRKSQLAANGLFTGQSSAPVFTFIFAENLITGDHVVPAEIWDLGFLVNGEGPGTGPLVPQPW